MKIVKETLTSCINRAGSDLPSTRYYVIEEPISETGICKAFQTEADAKRYITEHTIITVKNNGETVFTGEAAEFIAINYNDEDVKRQVNKAIETGSAKFVEFTGEWEITKQR